MTQAQFARVTRTPAPRQDPSLRSRMTGRTSANGAVRLRQFRRPLHFVPSRPPPRPPIPITPLPVNIPRFMHVAETIIGLLLAVAVIAWVAARVKVPYPILLVVGGLGLSFIPGLPHVRLDPHLVFVLFLPPLLYYAGLLTSWRDFRANIRPISLLATGLVLFTTCLVAAAAHFVIGMDWAPAFVLGAIVSPPDAVAATAITERLRVPRRVSVILEGESLVNDATALVAYRFAVAAIVTGAFSLGQASARFVLVVVGGVLVGLLAAMLVAWVRPRLKDSAVEGMLSLLTPYVAYLPAEWLGVSGVLAVVTAGIYISRRLGHITTPRVRLRAFATWETIIFLLNGLVFVLIGLQLAELRRAIPEEGWLTRIRYAAIIGGVAIAVRILWVFPAAWLSRRLPQKVRDPLPPPPREQVFLVAWTGMRGVVSLAAALALPEFTASGAPFPHRELIIIVTFGVILITLVGQGLTLPPLIRYLKLDKGVDDSADEETT